MNTINLENINFDNLEYACGLKLPDGMFAVKARINGQNFMVSGTQTESSTKLLTHIRAIQRKVKGQEKFISIDHYLINLENVDIVEPRIERPSIFELHIAGKKLPNKFYVSIHFTDGSFVSIAPTTKARVKKWYSINFKARMRREQEQSK